MASKKTINTERILGIDPGLANTGFGVIDVFGSSRKMVDYGCISTSAKMSFQDRLSIIHNDLIKVITKNRPSCVSIEDLFFCKNAKTVLILGHARGVAILAASLSNLPVYGYAPRVIKQAVVGYGGSDKSQVQEMVKIILGLPKIPKPDHASDALAVAICCSNHSLKKVI